MAAQTNYNYSTPKGVPGGKVDISFDEVITRRTEAEDGVLKYGMAVSVGNAAGIGITVPTSGTTAEKIEGVVVYQPNTEQDMKGNVVVKNGASLGVMRKGHIWARTSSDAEPTYGAKAYVVVDGNEAGAFTSSSEAVSVYKKCDSGTSGAKEVVSDETESPSGTQIKLSAVTPAENGYTPTVGDYVVYEQVHGAAVDIGATFGNAYDNGIAVVILK